MIERHAEATGSRRALAILREWAAFRPRFVKVIPRDYRRMLQAIASAQQEGLVGDEAVMGAFEANKADVARVGGL